MRSVLANHANRQHAAASVADCVVVSTGHRCMHDLIQCMSCGQLQMARGNVGSLLVFDPSKIDFATDDKVKSAAGDAVVGIITERGLLIACLLLASRLA